MQSTTFGVDTQLIHTLDLYIKPFMEPKFNPEYSEDLCSKRDMLMNIRSIYRTVHHAKPGRYNMYNSVALRKLVLREV